MTKIWCDISELREVEFTSGVKENIITYCSYRDEDGSCHKKEIIVHNQGCKNFVSGDEKKDS